MEYMQSECKICVKHQPIKLWLKILWQQESRLPHWLDKELNPTPIQNRKQIQILFPILSIRSFFKSILPNFIRHVAKKEMLIKKSSALYSKLKVLPKRTVRVIISENRPDLIYFQKSHLSSDISQQGG